MRPAAGHVMNSTPAFQERTFGAQMLPGTKNPFKSYPGSDKSAGHCSGHTGTAGTILGLYTRAA